MLMDKETIITMWAKCPCELIRHCWIYTACSIHTCFTTLIRSVSDLSGVEGVEQLYDMELGLATMAENLLIVCGLDNLSDVFSAKPGYLAQNIIK